MRRQLGLRLWFTYLVVETLLSDHQYHRQGPITDYLLPGMYTGKHVRTRRKDCLADRLLIAWNRR